MDLEALARFMEERIPFNKLLGMRVVTMEKGHVAIEVPFRPELVGDAARPALHGGVLSALADTAGGAALWSGVEDPRGRVSTIDLRIDYLRPARLETIVADARVVRLGNRVGVVDVRLYHPGAEHETVATGKGVYNVVVKKHSTAEGLTPRRSRRSRRAARARDRRRARSAPTSGTASRRRSSSAAR